MNEQIESPEDQERRLAILTALGLTLAAKRAEAKAHRAASGIEDEWLGDEEFYQGYDDANRAEFVNTASKPTASGASSGVTVKAKGSTVFPNITQPYCDATAARVGDMLLPTGDRNFAVDPTPIPEIGKLIETIKASIPQEQQQKQQMAAQAGKPSNSNFSISIPSAAMPEIIDNRHERFANEGDLNQMQLALRKQAEQIFAKLKAEAARKADKAQTRIDDWLSEANYHAEVRKMIDDCAKLGSGVMKGPVPTKVKSRKWTRNEDGDTVLEMIEEIKPASFRVDPWNLFPDPACGESIHNGSYIFERDYLTAKKLEALIGLPGYLEEQINICLDEGATRGDGDPHRSSVQSTKDQFEVWYYHGIISAEEMDAAGCDCGEDKRKSYPVKITMVNDHVIRAAMNPLDSGDFPYDVVAWKRRPNMPWGMGIARQMRTPQRIVVAATRNLMNNAGRAAGPQFVVRRGVEPQDGTWEIKPDKIWVEGEDADGNSGAPFMTITIPMLQRELMEIIQLGKKLAEDVTGLPMLLQGQQGKAPDTVGGMQILNNNGNSVLRRIARLFDVFTESHVRRYYAWLMEYGEDDDEKGDFQIIARGSTALVERDIQNQEMVQVLQMSLNPAFKKNPAKAMDEYLKSRRFDPAAFDYTEEEIAKLAQQQAPEDPRIAAAKIAAEARLKIEEMETKQLADHAVANAQLELHRMKFEAQQADLERQNKLAIAVIDERLKTTELTSGERNTLAKIKSELAQTSAKLRVQQDLSVAGHKVDLHKSRQALTPPTEPVGRAPNGMAFQA